jgi:hypothetical protein
VIPIVVSPCCQATRSPSSLYVDELRSEMGGTLVTRATCTQLPSAVAAVVDPIGLLPASNPPALAPAAFRSVRRLTALHPGLRCFRCLSPDANACGVVSNPAVRVRQAAVGHRRTTSSTDRITVPA